MTRQVSDKADLTIEDVRVQFETWRNTRKSRQPIPEQLNYGKSLLTFQKTTPFIRLPKPFVWITQN